MDKTQQVSPFLLELAKRNGVEMPSQISEKLKMENETLRQQVQELKSANETAQWCVRDKNEQLAIQDLEIEKFREALRKAFDTTYSDYLYEEWGYLLKIPFTPTHLNAHVEQKIKERIGEPKVWTWKYRDHAGNVYNRAEMWNPDNPLITIDSHRVFDIQEYYIVNGVEK